MENIYNLIKGESVKIINVAESGIRRFELPKSSEEFMIDFLTENVGNTFKVKDVFGNKILLENNVFVFDINISPVRDIEFKFNSLRNMFSMRITNEIFKKLKESNLDISYGFGLGLDKEGSIILPYDEYLLDYRDLERQLIGYLHVKNLQANISEALR